MSQHCKNNLPFEYWIFIFFSMSQYTEAYLKEKLTKELEAEHCEVTDLSDGCGGKFDALIVSKKFELSLQ